MHLYWRIKEELRYLGEDLLFHDPSLVREYRRWIQKQGGRLSSLQGQQIPATSKPPSGWIPLTTRN